ncbi:MAG TPA: hypothetical protein VMB50_02980 [Myxococcales bacterium]|nr:hypothetical protein [Myxococcales bacterium]
MTQRIVRSVLAAAVVLLFSACSSAPDPSTCSVLGHACSGDSDCCSNVCASSPINGKICQCASNGGDCVTNEDCCDNSNPSPCSSGFSDQLGTCN